MTWGRVVSSVASCTAVAGCAVLAIGMARSGGDPKVDAGKTVAPNPMRTSRPAVMPPEQTKLGTAPAPQPSALAAAAARTTTPPSMPAAVPIRPNVIGGSPGRAQPISPAAARPAAVAPPAVDRTAAEVAPNPASRPVAYAGSSLPLRYPTGSATRVITVTATSHGSTTATLQAWTKGAGGKWLRYGSSVIAHIGADGIGTASESRSATPAGTFTLTQAFGHNSDPGTGLPYLKTNSSDYWISSPGRLYNTHQRCSNCGYNNGVNERLYYETPYYNYAVVIDYNTGNAPGGVHAGKGSAFFLHVTDGRSTAGCVAIPQSRLIPLMRWLTPSAHPRILIGVT